jgi:tetrahydromethanopterin S-methyltransferase subunit G
MASKDSITAMTDFDKINARFDKLEVFLESSFLAIGQQFQAIDERFDRVEKRLDKLEATQIRMLARLDGIETISLLEQGLGGSERQSH